MAFPLRSHQLQLARVVPIVRGRAGTIPGTLARLAAPLQGGSDPLFPFLNINRAGGLFRVGTDTMVLQTFLSALTLSAVNQLPPK